jgi:Fic family protein
MLNQIVFALKSEGKGLIAMIFCTKPLDAKEAAVLADIDKQKQDLRYAISAPRRWSGLLRRTTFARAVQGSNSIEGYNVTLDDAIAAVQGEEPLDPNDEAWLAVTGYRDAMTFVLQKVDDPYFTLSEEVLKALHFMMLKYDLTKNPGRWRSGPILVKDEKTGDQVYEGPPAESVPGLMSELIASINRASDASVPVIVQAAMAHLNLVMIHPFSDGNGRMGRCLQTLVLARSGVISPTFSSIEEYLGRNTQGYYDVLAEVGQGGWNPGRNAEPWIRFCLTAHYRQVMTLLRRTREIQRIWDELETLVKRLGLPERALEALTDAAMGLQVRNNTYRSVADISMTLASRDLKVLVDVGLLEGHGEKRGRYYRGSASLKAICQKAREPRSAIPDPFEEPKAPVGGLNLTLPGMRSLN